MLPEDASQVSFDSGAEGKTGWSKYEQTELFRGEDIADVYEAAKAGLGKSGFALRSASLEQGYAKGMHGMTMNDWNIAAGVYFKETSKGVKVKVIAEGSKDIGFSGDATSGGWTGEILSNMREYLSLL